MIASLEEEEEEEEGAVAAAEDPADALVLLPLLIRNPPFTVAATFAFVREWLAWAWLLALEVSVPVSNAEESRASFCTWCCICRDACP